MILWLNLHTYARYTQFYATRIVTSILTIRIQYTLTQLQICEVMVSPGVYLYQRYCINFSFNLNQLHYQYTKQTAMYRHKLFTYMYSCTCVSLKTLFTFRYTYISCYDNIYVWKANNRLIPHSSTPPELKIGGGSFVYRELFKTTQS